MIVLGPTTGGYSMTFRHGKDVPFPKMVRIRRMFKGAPSDLVEGIIKATPSAERAVKKQIDKANDAIKRRKTKK